MRDEPGQRHAILLTDGKNEHDEEGALERALTAATGVFECDCRGVGGDWEVRELRKVATALLGSYDIVARARPAHGRLHLDARGCVGPADRLGRAPGAHPQAGEVELLKQLEPDLDLTSSRMEVDPMVGQYPTGSWGDEVREFHLCVRVPPGTVGEPALRAAQVTLLVDGEKVGQVPVLAAWTDDAARSTHMNERVADALGASEMAAEVEKGVDAWRSDDMAIAADHLGRAVQLADANGNEEMLDKLSKLVEWDDPAHGTGETAEQGRGAGPVGRRGRCRRRPTGRPSQRPRRRGTRHEPAMSSRVARPVLRRPAPTSQARRRPAATISTGRRELRLSRRAPIRHRRLVQRVWPGIDRSRRLNRRTPLPSRSAAGGRRPPLCPNCGSTTSIDPCPDCGGGSGPDHSTFWDEELWVALVEADRRFFEIVDPDDMTFPDVPSSRRIPLVGEAMGIGRKSSRLGITPEIDLSGSLEDLGVSRRHAVLMRQPDGTWSVVDQESSNGTYVNYAPDPIPANDPVPLETGDRVHVGVWTTLIMVREEAPPPSREISVPSFSTRNVAPPRRRWTSDCSGRSRSSSADGPSR